jgi:hypothetical protein
MRLASPRSWLWRNFLRALYRIARLQRSAGRRNSKNIFGSGHKYSALQTTALCDPAEV